jgi:iron complex outermembrane recepter protein
MNTTRAREAARCPAGARVQGLRWSALALAIASAQAVYAQSADQGAQEEIVVTGSRIRLDGMETPNPVTVVTPEQLSLTSPLTLVEGAAELPQFYASNTTANTGGFFTTSGAGSLNLRGLGQKRTLQLLDGRRVAPSTLYGGPDINLFPASILRSVETVTSGATATYGTDAVAGVVNFILDTNFEGFRGDVQTGQNDRGDNQSTKASFSAGFSLGENERTHVLVSGETFDQDPIWSRNGYDWFQGYGLIQSSAPGAGTTIDNPLNVLYPHVVSRSASLDGVITFPAASGLGVWAVDPSGNASPFQVGSAFDAGSHSIANGGSGTDNSEPAAQLQPKTSRDNFFGYVEHNFTDNFKVYGQAIYGETSFTDKNLGGGLVAQRAVTIYRGNPFLPASIAQLLAANPSVPSVTLGRVGTGSDLAFDAFTQQDTEMTSLTAGFELNLQTDGFFNDWVVEGYYQDGNTDVDAIQRGGVRVDRLYLATDAVVAPNGNTVCRVTLTSGLYPDCVPLNLFGRGRASAAAVDWVTGFTPGNPVSTNGWLPAGARIPYSYTSTPNKVRVIELEQDVFEFSANGNLADGWAGPIAMALGVAYRDEGFVQYVQAPEGNPPADPDLRPVPMNDAGCPGVPVPATPIGVRGVPCIDATNSVEFQFSKVPFGIGDFSVKEAFTEFRVPLVSDRAFAERMDLDLAYRWADYSGSGGVESWKVGFEWAISDLVRFRSTKSQDVRAANLGERYDRTGGLANIRDSGEDPAKGTNTQYDVTIVTGGNPNVRPEEAHTTTAGFVFRIGEQRLWNLSVDWYDIDIKDNIALYGTQNVIDNCHILGDVDSCAQIQRAGPQSTVNPALNRISIVNDIYVNVTSAISSGVDVELSHNRPVDWFGGSDVGFRLLGSYLRENSRINSVGVETDYAGANSVFGLLPARQFILSGNFSHGPLSFALQGRYQDDVTADITRNIYAPPSPTWPGGVRYNVSDNVIDKVTIFDATFAYNFDLGSRTNLRLYLTANNLFDEDPLANPILLGGLDSSVGTGVLVDTDRRGRRYAVGLNFDF